MAQAKKISALVADRLEALRVRTGWSWDKIAEALEVNRSMIFHVKSGNRQFSPKVLHRLDRLESKVVVTSRSAELIEQGLNPMDVVETLLGDPKGQTQVGIEEIDRGFVDVPLRYRRGDPPAGYPKKKIRIRTPKNSETLKVREAVRRSSELEFVVPLCLPEKYQSLDILEKLTPASYWDLLRTCMTLTFGLDWRQSIAACYEVNLPKTMVDDRR